MHCHVHEETPPSSLGESGQCQPSTPPTPHSSEDNEDEDEMVAVEEMRTVTLEGEPEETEDSTDTTWEAMESRQKKELKRFDGEKRAAFKKVKNQNANKKKAKEEMLEALEKDYATQLDAMQLRHEQERQRLVRLGVISTMSSSPEVSAASAPPTASQAEASPEIDDYNPKEKKDNNNSKTNGNANGNGKGNGNSNAKEQQQQDQERRRIAKKIEKQQSKRQRAKQKEKEREQEQRRITEEASANQGRSARDDENALILKQLTPLQLTIRETIADGHCLFRAVAAQCSDTDTTNTTTETTTTTYTYADIRRKCAQVMTAHRDVFAPFCAFYSDHDNNDNDENENDSESTVDFDTYVHRVEYCAEHWGGHVELRAIAMALHRPILVYSATTATSSSGPIRIDAVEDKNPGIDATDSRYNDDNYHADHADVKPIRLSFHRHYYALGDHYNQVVPISSSS